MLDLSTDARLAAARGPVGIPRLSLAERDRRWALVRAEMAARKLDAIVLWGWPLMWDFYTANARYLSSIGGNAEFNVMVFPLEGEPTSFIQLPTFLQGWADAQDWVTDIRARRTSWAFSVATRLQELGLQSGRIGMDGFAGPLDPDGWLPVAVHRELTTRLSDATILPLDDMLEKVRSVKSEEELGLLRHAATIGDAMLETCRTTARLGVADCEVYANMHREMLVRGGEDPTLFLWNCSPLPYPHPFRLPSTRPIERGDVIICEMHPKYAGYFTHVERTFSLGEPHDRQRKIYEGCRAAFERGMEGFGAGRPISVAMDAVKDDIEANQLGICEAGIHGHGLASLEYPRYRHHAIKADREAIKVIGDEFQVGMVFAFNIDLFDPSWHEGKTGCVFAETVEITAEGPRRLHSYPMEFQVIGV